MKIIQMNALGLSAWALLLAACTSTGKGGPQTTIQGAEGLPGTTELDSGQSLNNDLEQLNVVTARKGDYMVVQLELHNKRGSQIKLEWSVDWFDEDGLQIVSNENWRPLTIGGRGFERIQITAPTPSARAYQLKIQKPNPIR